MILIRSKKINMNLNQTEINRFSNLLQGFVLLTTVAVIFMSIGSAKGLLDRNADSINELQSIAADLVRSQVMSSATDSGHSDRIAELLRRVEKLESSN